MVLTAIGAFCIIMILLAVGEIVSTLTKAFIPSVFVTSILFLIGYWTIMPKDIMATAQIDKGFIFLCVGLLMVHLGTIMDFKELISQWKAVVIALSGLVGVCVMTLTIGRIIFGWQNVVMATPPLTGGVVALIIMSKAAGALGLEKAIILASGVFIMQALVGYPVEAFLLKKEAARIANLLRNGTWEPAGAALGEGKSTVHGETETKQKRRMFQIFPTLPENFLTPYLIITKLAIVVWVAFQIAPYLYISKYVVCLLVGVIGREIGFLEGQSLNKANSFGILMTLLMIFVFSQMAMATPEMVLELIGPILGILALGISGMVIVGTIVAKLLGYTKELGIAVAMTALFGFPADYILCVEAAKSNSESKEEYNIILAHILNPMLIGGFATVSIASVLIAGVFVKFL